LAAVDTVLLTLVSAVDWLWTYV